MFQSRYIVSFPGPYHRPSSQLRHAVLTLVRAIIRGCDAHLQVELAVLLGTAPIHTIPDNPSCAWDDQRVHVQSSACNQ